MFTQQNLEVFLKEHLPVQLNKLHPQLTPRWGQMNVQQMTEHLSLTFLMATGQFKVKLTTDAEKIPVFKRYLMDPSKDFPQNFQNPLLPAAPIPVTTAGLNEARTGLMQSVEKFFVFFTENPAAVTLNNVWGELNYLEWMVMNYKHIKHHFAQFGIALSAMDG